MKAQATPALVIAFRGKPSERRKPCVKALTMAQKIDAIYAADRLSGEAIMGLVDDIYSDYRHIIHRQGGGA